MGKSQETQQLAGGMSGKCGFGSYRPHLWLFPWKKGLSEKSKTAIIIPTIEPDSVIIKHKLPTSRLIYSVQLGQLSNDPPFGTAPSSLMAFSLEELRCKLRGSSLAEY